MEQLSLFKDFVVGCEVVLLVDVYEGPDEYAPGGYLARKGETLVVRGFSDPKFVWDVLVSHAHVTDRFFAVGRDEIERR